MTSSQLSVAVVFFCILFPYVIASTCGYEACPRGKPDHLNVHIICHSHDDVGWLHTVDNYYDMWVRDIISSAIGNLVQDENRRFIYVETAFFWMWWQQQTDLVKEYVRRLVNDGRLEFISGGWSMNDEATTHYLGIIDQMTLGLRWLNETFGKCAAPKVGWQIDSFGHSREQASLFAQMHFDGQFIGRIHYQDKQWRKKMKAMEMIWKTSQSLGEKAYLFTGVLPNVYWPPKGFCFDAFCSDEELTDDNIQARSYNFITLALDQAKYYGTNHIIMTMGLDFHYRDSAKWYRNLDMLISHVNSLQAVGMKVNIFYSTPTCYLFSLNQANITWPTISDDFFPYASKQHEYWTGFFTSRPALKYNIRRSNAFLQTCKQLIALSFIENADVNTLARALGVSQHHDAITGTEKQHVSDDYTVQLTEGIKMCENAMKSSLKNLILKNRSSTLMGTEYSSPKIFLCQTLNISQCDFTEAENEFYLVVYNSLGHRVKSFIRLPITKEGYRIKQISKRRRNIPAQIVPIPYSVLRLPERVSSAHNELVFPVALRPLSLTIYKVKTIESFAPVNDMDSGKIATSVQDTVIGNENIQVVIDGYSGLMKEIVLLPINERLLIRQSFYYYEGMPGYRIERASGAYAFNPQFDTAFPLGENITYRVFKGRLVEEVHQYFTSWISQVIRIYKGHLHIEFDWVVGPIPIHEHLGREVISRFDSQLQTEQIFFTDSNGRETIRRIRNYKDSWPWNVTENISGNYYPVTSWISVQDKSRGLQLSVLTDRAQGGSSIKDGSIELMVHRRLLFDDGFGVNEALNEGGYDGRGLIVRGTHLLTFGSIDNMKVYNKKLAKKMFYSPLLCFIKYNSSETANDIFSEFQFRGLNSNLPPNIHLLTLEKLDNQKVLLRFEHFYESGDGTKLSNPTTFSITKLFTPFKVRYYQETTLAANKYLYEVERLRWSYVGQQSENESHMESHNLTDPNYFDDIVQDSKSSSLHTSSDGSELNITLRPMEIRTFIVKIDNFS